MDSPVVPLSAPSSFNIVCILHLGVQNHVSSGISNKFYSYICTYQPDEVDTKASAMHSGILSQPFSETTMHSPIFHLGTLNKTVRFR